MADKSPAFQFYPRDFLANDAVSMMTNEQIGAYVLLLCHAWQRPEGLPLEMGPLSKLARCPQRRFEQSIWPTVRERFVSTETGWKNDRLEDERRKQCDFREAASRAGKRSGEARQRTSVERPLNDRSDSVDVSLERKANGNATLHLLSATAVKPHTPIDDPPVAEFLEGYRERYQRVTGGALPLTVSPKDFAIATELLRTWPLPRLLDMAELYLHRTDRDVAGKPKTLAWFKPMAPWADTRLREAGR